MQYVCNHAVHYLNICINLHQNEFHAVHISDENKSKYTILEHSNGTRTTQKEDGKLAIEFFFLSGIRSDGPL